MADIDSEEALPSLKEHFIVSIKERIVDKEELQIMNISEADERKNVIYQYDLDESPLELAVISTLLENGNQLVFNFDRDSINDIKAYIVILGNNQTKLLLYKQHYPISLIRRDAYMLRKAKERFVRFNEELIRLDNNFQFFSFNGILFIKDLDKLERFFGFHDVIKKEALSSIARIERANILEDTDVLTESLENITFARKLTKLSAHSPVLTGKLKYNRDESKIILDTKKSQNLFIKLLNDDYLKSELTQMYYDSLAKDQIPNAGA